MLSGGRTINKIHYNAFISYRHSELDSEIASGIHKRLEAFSLPKNLRNKFPKEQHKIRRVFRDTEELPLADNLSDPINEALQNSDWLIVICSPRLRESLWCAKEIELFSKYKGKDHILAVLAEGEPADSFPQAICFRERTVTDANGNTQVIRETVEPLAADVRGPSKKIRKKKMDDAILRMAAPMYGLGYDDLKQRHREQRIRKMALIASLVASVFLIYAVTSTVLSVHINNQRKIIAEQHLQLEEDYHKQQIKFAQSMSLVSGDLLKRGLGQAAVYSARMALPDSLDDTATPYVPECQYALSNALGIYEVDVFFPEEIIDKPSESFWQGPGDFKFLENYLGGQQIMCAAPFKEGYELIVTSNSAVYLYDIEDGVLTDYSVSFFPEVPKEYVEAAAYKDDSLYILFSKSDSVVRYKYRPYEGYESAGKGSLEERIASRGEIPDIGDEVKSDDGKYIAVRGTDNNLLIYSASDKKRKHCLKKIYDKSGVFCTMKKLEGTDYYLLLYTGKYGYLLDEDLNVIARVSNFYDYSEKKQSFILYHTDYNGLEYDLYYMPLMTYEDIIEQADDILADFEPSDELIERYQIFKDGE